MKVEPPCDKYAVHYGGRINNASHHIPAIVSCCRALRCVFGRLGDRLYTHLHTVYIISKVKVRHHNIRNYFVAFPHSRKKHKILYAEGQKQHTAGKIDPKRADWKHIRIDALPSCAVLDDRARPAAALESSASLPQLARPPLSINYVRTHVRTRTYIKQQKHVRPAFLCYDARTHTTGQHIRGDAYCGFPSRGIRQVQS